jgi:hypothetical protein
MRYDHIQRAARAAFTPEDWLLLMEDAVVGQRFPSLHDVKDVEAFVFEAYDRLRHLREGRKAAGARKDQHLTLRL